MSLHDKVAVAKHRTAAKRAMDVSGDSVATGLRLLREAKNMNELKGLTEEVLFRLFLAREITGCGEFKAPPPIPKNAPNIFTTVAEDLPPPDFEKLNSIEDFYR